MLLERYVVEILRVMRNNRAAGVMLREILRECLVIIAYNVQSTVTSHIVRNVASILRAKSQVILVAKIVSNPSCLAQCCMQGRKLCFL